MDKKCKKVVLVDDYADFVEVEKDFIEHFCNVECITFTNPQEALQYMLKEKNIDILITDYQMPQMTGFTLADGIIKQGLESKIIVCSGYGASELADIRKEYGLEDKVEVASKDELEYLVDMINQM